jgi:hypothetical protein
MGKYLRLRILYAGPLFIHQFSHAWIDFEASSDEFMREKGSDYFQNSGRATYVQREFAQAQSARLQRLWRRLLGHLGQRRAGLQDPDHRQWPPSDASSAMPRAASPTDLTMAHSPPAPHSQRCPSRRRSCCRLLRALCERYPHMTQDSRLPGGFNPTLPGEGPQGWMSEGYFGLDQGMRSCS